jgi:hypothetical protein
VDIEDAVGEGGNELGREQAHVAGKADKVDVVIFETVDDFGVVVGAKTALGDKELVRDSEFGCGFEATGVGYVGDDDGDLHAGKGSHADGLGDGQEVGAAAGEQNTQAD